jgi:hypothetical protein
MFPMMDLDLSKEQISETSPGQPGKEPWHPDKAKMKLAYVVLIGIFVVFISTFFVNHFAETGYIDSDYSTALLELCKTGLLPIVTLILGYYFSNNS